MKMSRIFATVGPIGYLAAPGTMGTIAAIPLVYFVSYFSNMAQLYAVSLFVVFSFFIIHQALPWFVSSDPSEIIIDEVAGCLVTFIGIPLCVPSMVAGFLLFRLFDILKPFGIKRIEKLPGSCGVLLDDCVAGLYANLILRYLMQ